MHVHGTASRILEIVIRNQLALIKDKLLCHWHSGFLIVFFAVLLGEEDPDQDVETEPK